MDTKSPANPTTETVKEPVKETVATTPVKKSNKAIVIVIAVAGGLLICLTVVILIALSLAPQLREAQSIKDCTLQGGIYDLVTKSCISQDFPTITPSVSESVTPEPTATSTVTPSATSLPDEPKVVSNVAISFTKPEKVADSNIYVQQLEPGNYPQPTYKVGTFTAGQILNKTKNTTLILTGAPLYMAILQDSPQITDNMLVRSGLHFTIVDGKKYLLEQLYATGDTNAYFNAEFNLDYISINFDDYSLPSAIQAHKDDTSLKSDKGIEFKTYPYYWPTLFDINDMTAVDTLYGNTLYIRKSDANSRTFVKANDGYMFSLEMNPSIYGKTSDTSYFPQVTWNDNTKVKNVYESSSIGVCMGDGLEVIKNPPALTKTGRTTAGEDVYEATDQNDAVRTDIYNSHYIRDGYYKYNETTLDDTKPFTYNEYLKYHPVFYWKDAYGRYIKFVSTEFMAVGGCGKPVINLYPQKTTEMSVQVIPNGRLTLTIPQIGKNNTWNVIAKKNSVITDKATGKTFDYLWWESKGVKNLKRPNGGFIIKMATLEKDLTALLKQMGMSDSETKAFNEYWLPKMTQEKADSLYVTFLFNDDVKQIADLKFDPQPDYVNRVFMLYRPAKSGEQTKALTMPTFMRQDFYVVEWGGARDL